MKVYSLPLYSDSTARWTSQFDLNGYRYTIYFSWNTRCEYWEMSIYDNDEKLIVGGIRLVLTIDLLDEYRAYKMNLPVGKLSVVPRNDNVRIITRDNLNSDFVLMYSEK